MNPPVILCSARYCQGGWGFNPPSFHWPPEKIVNISQKCIADPPLVFSQIEFWFCAEHYTQRLTRVSTQRNSKNVELVKLNKNPNRKIVRTNLDENQTSSIGTWEVFTKRTMCGWLGRSEDGRWMNSCCISCDVTGAAVEATLGEDVRATGSTASVLGGITVRTTTEEGIRDDFVIICAWGLTGKIFTKQILIKKIMKYEIFAFIVRHTILTAIDSGWYN